MRHRYGKRSSQAGEGILLMTTAHQGADRFNRELLLWRPALRSADADLLPDLATLVARTRDLIRNNGLASGAVQTHLDHVIGSGLRLSAKPDWRALGLDADWAAEWSRDVEAKHRLWAYDVDKYSDAARRLTQAGRLGQAYRSYLSAGEILATAEWLPDRGSRYATAIQMVLPDRLSNPGDGMDTARLRGGVELDANGAPVAHHIRRAHRSDARYFGARAWEWRRVPRETPWGRAQVIHIFDQEYPGQTRGKTGFTSILKRTKKLDRFEDVALEAAVINAMYAAVVESDLASAMDAIGGGDVSEYVQQVAAFNKGAPLEFDGVKIPHLFPGEKLTLTQPGQPTDTFAPFEDAFLSHLAAGTNLSKEQLTHSYKDTNYSGARAGLEQAWRFFQGRRDLIGGEYATQEYALWLEEAIDKGDVEIPQGAPDFYEAKTAWVRCQWIGPPKGNIDPLKDAKGDALLHDYGVKTKERWCAEQGEDWEETMEQRAREINRERELEEQYGITFPSPSGSDAGVVEQAEVVEGG